MAGLRIALHQAYARMLTRRTKLSATELVDHFLDQHLSKACSLGWTDVGLFGCHPDPALALVRYDCMGALTIAACMGWQVVAVSVDTIRLANGLASRRSQPTSPALPVWETFPLSDRFAARS